MYQRAFKTIFFVFPIQQRIVLILVTQRYEVLLSLSGYMLKIASLNSRFYHSRIMDKHDETFSCNHFVPDCSVRSLRFSENMLMVII